MSNQEQMSNEYSNLGFHVIELISRSGKSHKFKYPLVSCSEDPIGCMNKQDVIYRKYKTNALAFRYLSGMFEDPQMLTEDGNSRQEFVCDPPEDFELEFLSRCHTYYMDMLIRQSDEKGIPLKDCDLPHIVHTIEWSGNYDVYKGIKLVYDEDMIRVPETYTDSKIYVSGPILEIYDMFENNPLGLMKFYLLVEFLGIPYFSHILFNAFVEYRHVVVPFEGKTKMRMAEFYKRAIGDDEDTNSPIVENFRASINNYKNRLVHEYENNEYGKKFIERILECEEDR